MAQNEKALLKIAKNVNMSPSGHAVLNLLRSSSKRSYIRKKLKISDIALSQRITRINKALSSVGITLHAKNGELHLLEPAILGVLEEALLEKVTLPRTVVSPRGYKSGK